MSRSSVIVASSSDSSRPSSLIDALNSMHSSTLIFVVRSRT